MCLSLVLSPVIATGCPGVVKYLNIRTSSAIRLHIIIFINNSVFNPFSFSHMTYLYKHLFIEAYFILHIRSVLLFYDHCKFVLDLVNVTLTWYPVLQMMRQARSLCDLTDDSLPARTRHSLFTQDSRSQQLHPPGDDRRW